MTDARNGESVVGANVFTKELNVGSSSNTYGFYSITLPKGNYNLSFSFIG